MEKYDLYWARFHFEEDFTQWKRRPGLVIDENKILPLFAKVTSNTALNGPYDCIIDNYEEAGLTVPSIVRLDKIEGLMPNEVGDYIGHLSDDDVSKVEDLLKKIDNDSSEKDQENSTDNELSINPDSTNVQIEDIYLRFDFNKLQEDYWFGGNGKMDIPERSNLQGGENELELRVDDVTQDNEDQDTEEQEEELNESLIDESDYVIVPRGEGKFVYCDRYGDPILEIEVSTDGSIKVIEKNTPATLSTPDSVYEIKDEYQTMDEFDKDFKSYISDNLEYETLEEGKKFSFKDSYICQGCGNKLSKCTCDVKDDKLKEEATQPSNIGQHKRSSIDLMGDDNAKDSEMIKSLDKMVNEDETAEK